MQKFDFFSTLLFSLGIIFISFTVADFSITQEPSLFAVMALFLANYYRIITAKKRKVEFKISTASLIVSILVLMFRFYNY